MQNEIKTEMEQKISDHSVDSKIILLSFTTIEFNDISWIEEDEFSKDGILYDVISIDKKENGQYSLKVVQDKKEKLVLNALCANSEQNSSAKKCAHLFFQIFSQFSSPNEVFNQYDHPKTIENNFIYLDHYSFLYSKQNFPPPKSA